MSAPFSWDRLTKWAGRATLHPLWLPEYPKTLGLWPGPQEYTAPLTCQAPGTKSNTCRAP